MVNTLESVFLKMAVLKPHKLKYYKLLGEDAGKFEIWDYIMTEESIMQGFESVFGVKCDIFAKILYINLSKMCDYVRLSFKDFVDGIQPLREISSSSKSRFAFDFLDIDKDG